MSAHLPPSTRRKRLTVDFHRPARPFSFRCHRHETASTGLMKKTEVWAVNDVNFHPVHSATISTAGSDGCFFFWDLIAHQRLAMFPKRESAITATAFNRDGKVFAYAIGYDWAKGYAEHSPSSPLKLMLHPVLESEVASRKK